VPKSTSHCIAWITPRWVLSTSILDLSRTSRYCSTPSRDQYNAWLLTLRQSSGP